MPPASLLLSLALGGAFVFPPVQHPDTSAIASPRAADTLDVATSAGARSDSTRRAHPVARHVQAVPRILATAAWTQLLGSPKEWPRTTRGFAGRVGDQAGIYTVQRTVGWAIGAGLGWSPDERRCERRAAVHLAQCALGRTLSARDDAGAWRPPVPLLASVGAAALVSVTWRPEREDAGDARAFVATRAAFMLAGRVTQRLVKEWRRR